ncbi:MAG: SusC/RagA family TonB-linked outer membrane protein [Gemmatimonadales bacterium]
MTRLGRMIGGLLVLPLFVPVAAHAQSGTIRGTVTVGEGTPVGGAVVRFGARSALTRVDGTYVLSGVEGTDTLRVRLIGYAPAAKIVTLGAGQTAEADFVLIPSAVNLAEIVVTGYGEQRAGNITGAVTQVSSADFNTGRVISPEELIRSKVAGVQVVDNNEPGGGFSIRIRGATSINASSEPLFVIDGVPVGAGAGGGLSAGRNPLNFLNPNEIDNITVLRDASAAAIYGANAANGVVLIQTKSGRKGAPQFEYTGTMSTSSVTKLPDMLNAAQFKTAVTQYAPQNVSQLGNANTDWLGQVTQASFGQEHTLAVSGATDQSSWRLSAGYLNQDGIVKGTTAERVSLGFNFNQRLFDDRLDLKAFVKGSRTDDRFTPGGVLSNATQFGPTQPILDAATKTGYYDWPGNALQSPDNPVALLTLAKDEGITYRSIGNLAGQYRIPGVDALRANLNMAYDIAKADRQQFNPSVLHGETKTGQGGRDLRQNFTQSNTTLETYLSYATSLGTVPGSIDLTGGYSYGWSHAEYPSYLATGLSTDLLGGSGVTSARTVQNFQDVQESRLISFFGRANYNYRDKYLVGVSVRRDGSSRFGPSHQWGTFPAVSVGWRVTEDLEGLKGTFSDLKLRGSWARTGNQAFANYQQYANFVLGDAQTQAQFGNTFIPTLRPSAVDPSIRWEATSAWDVGADFSMFSDKVRGSIDWYTKNTDDLIFTVPVAAGTNLSNFLTTNIGSMKNTGFEATISSTLITPATRDGFGWTVDVTAAHNKNELTSINPFGGESQLILTGLVSGGVGTFIQALQPGQPINSFYVYRHKLGSDGKPIYSSDQKDMYEDLNNDGTINQDDRVATHDPAPKWMLGLSSYMNYGRLDVSFTLRSYLGNYVYNNIASNLGTYSEVTRASPYNLHASVLETGFETPQYLSDYYVENGSFLRMDNVTVAYQFNYKQQPMRVFATMQNAFTITGYSGVDPTAGLQGLDNNIYPRARTITAGLSLRF